MTTVTTLQALLDKLATITHLTTRLQAAVVRLLAVDSAADAKVARLRQDSEPYDLMGAEHHRKDIAHFRTEYRRARALAAGAARYDLESSAPKFEHAARTFIADRRRDPYVTCPDARNHMRPGDMLNEAIYRELRRPYVAGMTIDQLSPAYQHALDTRDAAAAIDLQLIEERVLRAVSQSWTKICRRSRRCPR